MLMVPPLMVIATSAAEDLLEALMPSSVASILTVPSLIVTFVPSRASFATRCRVPPLTSRVVVAWTASLFTSISNVPPLM